MDIFSPTHLIILLVIILLLFGTKKLRNIGSDLGNAVRGFKKAMHTGEEGEDGDSKTVGGAEKLQADPPPAAGNAEAKQESHESAGSK